MKNTEQKIFFRNFQGKYIIHILLVSIFCFCIYGFSISNGLVNNGAYENTLSGENNNFVNLSNSGVFRVNFSLSGTLDTGDTFLLTAGDGSGQTTTGSYLSTIGGESSGSISLSFSSGSWREGQIVFSGIVYTGGIMNQVVASGIALIGILDRIPPTILLTTTAPNSISGSVSIDIQTSEGVGGLALNDIIVTNATLNGFVQTSLTGYSFILTPVTSTGIISISVDSNVFSDMAGNPNSISNTLSFGILDTMPPVITITYPTTGTVISGFPTLTGSVTDSGGIASIYVNGFLATIGSGIWSKTMYDLMEGDNTIVAIARDLSGNTGSASILLNRISYPLNTNVELSGTTSALVTFSTDLSATGVIAYGTNINTLNSSVTGSIMGTNHSFMLMNLTPDTIYYFAVGGQDGMQSPIMDFKTPTIIDITTISGLVTTTSAIYLSGITTSGAIFVNSGSIGILSLTASGSSLSIPFSGLTITNSGGNWDGVLQAPEVTSDRVNLSLSGYAFTGTFYQIGNAGTELIFSGQLATIGVHLGTSLAGKNVRIFRSPDRGTTFTEISPTCTVTITGDCIFATNQLSRFAFAVPGDVMPDIFSFPDIINAELSTPYVSNPINITGIEGQTMVSIIGGEYSINNTPFTTLTGAVNPGDLIVLRKISSASNATSTSTILTIGGVSSTFRITTKMISSNGTSTDNGRGGGIGLGKDICPSGDTSQSYYDGVCSIGAMKKSEINNAVTTTVNSIFTGSIFRIPPVLITRPTDFNFTDIEDNWAQFYIVHLASRGIIDNAKLYRPDDGLTRAEFLKIIINSAGWSLPSLDRDIPFEDVPFSAWYAPYISLALSRGMITGTNRNFRPNDKISRAEAAKILMTAPGKNVNEPTTITFYDLDLTSNLTKYIEAARSMGIFSGQERDGRLFFRPNDPITRAEIAKVIVKAFGL